MRRYEPDEGGVNAIDASAAASVVTDHTSTSVSIRSVW